MVRLGVAKGGRAETLMGLTGLGDLALTCNNEQSRNMRLGIALGRGMTRAAAIADPALRLGHAVVEGVEARSRSARWPKSWAWTCRSAGPSRGSCTKTPMSATR